jgi:hypothetical protein
MNHEFVDAATLQIDRAQVLLDAALPHHGAVLSVIHEQPSNSIMLGTGAERGATALLYAGGEHVARLRVSVRYRWQAHHAALAVEESRFTLFLTTDRQPLVRFEFQDALTNTPPSHWHLHAERGSFSALLSRTRDRGAGRRDPARLSSLHFPLGDTHFRPSLADIVEFVVTECGVDALPHWERAVHEYRKHWRRDEAAATARRFSAETATALRGLGWQVRSPVTDELPAPFVSLVAG